MNGHSFFKCGAQGLNLCALLNRTTTNQNTQFCAFVELRNNNGGLLEL